MSLALLLARRVATPGAAVLVAFVSWFALRGAGGAQSMWQFAVGLVALVATVRAAAIPHEWLTREGDWLGSAAWPRWRIVLAGLSGAGGGAAALALIPAFIGGIHAAGENSARVEISLLAGPARSVVLMPGSSFEQAVGGQAGGLGHSVRVRTTATVGGETPTTVALVEAGAFREETIVPRRTWLEAPLDATANMVRVTNVGEGALAVLGPRPVEVWRPSTALLGGHLRAFLHAALFLISLAAGALLLGTVMGPGIAAGLAFSVWLGLRMALPEGTAWIPGGDGLWRALDALYAGRAPLPPSASCLGAVGALFALALSGGTALLRTWHPGSRT